MKGLRYQVQLNSLSNKQKKERKYNMLSWPQNVGNPQFLNFSVGGCPGNPLHGTAFGAAQS